VLESIRDQVRQAQVLSRPLRLRGGDTKRFYGETVRAESELDLRAYQGIVSHEPTELVITARCGTPLQEIEAALAEHRQMLAFEPPHFGQGATVGGMVAAGLSGPTRASVGAVRDFVLGAVLMDARGELLNFGGQVMKNVAGYDAARLLAGSLGVLGPILQVSLKVLPQPAAQTTLAMSMPAPQALRLLNAWAAQPLPIASSAWLDDRLVLRLQGAAAAVRSAASRLADTQGAIHWDDAEAASFWQEVREHRRPELRGSLWRVSVPSTAPMLPIASPVLIEWGGALRWVQNDGTAAQALQVRAAAAAEGGSATCFRAPHLVVCPTATGPVDAPQGPVFDALSPTVLALHRRLKQAFDPRGIFNPGRMHAEF
jgi:glycolate oxidase FAD binding subunit